MVKSASKPYLALRLDFQGHTFIYIEWMHFEICFNHPMPPYKTRPLPIFHSISVNEQQCSHLIVLSNRKNTKSMSDSGSLVLSKYRSLFSLYTRCCSLIWLQICQRHLVIRLPYQFCHLKSWSKKNNACKDVWAQWSFVIINKIREKKRKIAIAISLRKAATTAIKKKE